MDDISMKPVVAVGESVRSKQIIDVPIIFIYLVNINTQNNIGDKAISYRDWLMIRARYLQLIFMSVRKYMCIRFSRCDL